MVLLYLTAVAFLQGCSQKQHPVSNKWGLQPPRAQMTRTFATAENCFDADFLALGMGGTNMMTMLWSIAMGKSVVGVEMRGDPFLSIHWNIREDLYHQFGLIDDMMMERYGEEGVPRRANGKIFSLAECFYTPETTAGYVVADEVINGFDEIHHLAGTIHHYEFIDDRWKDGKPNRIVSTLPRPEVPTKPDPNAIRSSMKEVLDGPSTFQSEANNVLILLRRYIEAIEAMDKTCGREPRVRLFTRHQVSSCDDGFVTEKDGRISVNIEAVQELDFKGKLTRVPVSNAPRIQINAPDLCVIAQGVKSMDAERLGFIQKDVMVDHNDGQGPHVAQADYLAGFIDVLVDGRIRRRIASAFDDKGDEYWVRQIAVGHEGDPQVGWVLVQVPDYMLFDPVEAGYVSEDVEKDSVEYFAAHQRLLYEFYIRECSKLLEIPEENLKEVRMAYGPKMFSTVEHIGDNPRIAPNVFVAGDTFGNGHFLTSGGAMTGMVGHSMAVLNFWKAIDSGISSEEAYKVLAETIEKDTRDWLEGSAKEFSTSAPVNFGIDRINQVAGDSHICMSARAESIDASRRMRHDLSVQDPCDWRRPALRNGRVLTASLKPPLKQLATQVA